MANNDTRFKSPLTSPAQDPENFQMDDLEKRLKMIQLQRMEREELAIAEAEKALITARQAGIDSVKMKMANEKAKQDYCSHRKENQDTHLAGQKDHSGVINLICQGCQKAWRGTETIPHGLFPTREGACGGPQ